MPNLPSSLAIGAVYDTLLQSALRRFFARAAFETQSIPSSSPDAHVAIEPTDDPGALAVRWFGRRYLLRVPGHRPFTAHEVRLARAIGLVLSARYRASLDPQMAAERGDLFGGAIEDRYLGAFFDAAPYITGAADAPPDRVALAIEMMRMAALSTYENQPIATGVLLLGTGEDPVGQYPAVERARPHYTGALTSIKSFFRLADGLRTVFVVSRDGRLLDLVDIERWAAQAAAGAVPDAPCTAAYHAHARATANGAHVGVVLSPRQEIKVFAGGVQVFAFRNADWHLLDLEEKYGLWVRAVGQPAVARRIFQTALDLADARRGALFVVLRRPIESLPALVAPGDRLDMEPVGLASDPDTPSRRHLLHLLAGRTLTELDASVLAALAALDGATVTDRDGTLLAVGAILRPHPAGEPVQAEGLAEGARTAAALAASRFGPVLKVSADGMISCYDGGRLWDI